jgi:hypothetical protein
MDILRNTKRNNFLCKIIIIILFAILIIGLVQYIQKLSDSGFYNYLNNGHYKARNIDTPSKLWFNGYLGIFSRNHEFGYLNLLAIPFLLYIILLWGKFNRAVKAVFIVYIFSAILIGVKGFFNSRYAFTLYPLTIIAIFWLLYDFLKRVNAISNKNNLLGYKILSILLYLLIISLAIYSIDVRKKSYIYWWKHGNSLKYIKGPRIELIHSLERLNIGDNRKILVVNIIDFFYHTNIKGVMYSSLRFCENSENLWDRIEKENIRYILASDNIYTRPYYKILAEIMKDNLKVEIIKKAGGLKLYKVSG